MKRYLSEKQGLERLATIRQQFAGKISKDYEHKAKPCSSCMTPGACCLDAHFVNVRVSRLETSAIDKHLSTLSPAAKEAVEKRSRAAIEKYLLDEDPTNTYACPLYETGVGCLVHDVAKPLPCIEHACYESESDLPPDSLVAEKELEIDSLNERVYGRSAQWLPIPLAIASKPSST